MRVEKGMERNDEKRKVTLISYQKGREMMHGMLACRNIFRDKQ